MPRFTEETSPTQPETNFVALEVQMDPIIIFRVVVTQHGHGALANAADFVDSGVIKPDIARSNAQRRRRAVKDNAFKAVDGQAGVGPMQVSNQIFGKITILAAQAGEQLAVGEITCSQ